MTLAEILSCCHGGFVQDIAVRNPFPQIDYAGTHGGEVMYALEVLNGSALTKDIEGAAKKCLRDSPYKVFTWLSCECDHGVLFLRGHLSSFYLKQLAQEAVARIKGIIRVVNEIEVD
jgi:hypothetical protein